MKSLKNKVAVVTGAGQGIGRMLAVNLAKEGCSLALADVNQDSLKETATLIDNPNVKVTLHVVDVSERDEVYQFAAEANAGHGKVDLVINNAGVLLWEFIEDLNYDDFEWIMRINLWGVIYCSKAFLPILKKQREGHIVNLSSAAAFAPAPSIGPYLVSKCAVSGFTQTLCQELNRSHINVSCVYPGGVKTGIFRTGRIYKFASPQMNPNNSVKWAETNIARITPDKASKDIIVGIKKNKKRILIGLDAHILYWMSRLAPDMSSKLMQSFAPVKLLTTLKNWFSSSQTDTS